MLINRQTHFCIRNRLFGVFLMLQYFLIHDVTANELIQLNKKKGGYTPFVRTFFVRYKSDFNLNSEWG